MADSVLVERSNGLAQITLNRPACGNALDVPMARSLMEIAIELDSDDDIRCVFLTGAGRLFCAGGDVAGFAEAADRLPVYLREITTYLHAALASFARMEKPLVTAINGPVAGAGLGLALIGDIVLADPTAHFTVAYTALGLSPDGGTTWLLPRLVGLRRAQELCLRNTRVAANEAASMGMITRVTAQGTVVEEARAIAEQLAQSATPALGTVRRLLLESGTSPFETHLDAESRGIAAMGATAEGREGIAAFLEKRKPDFTKGH